MADNTLLDGPGVGGDKIATASLTFSGDTAKFQICGLTILAGSEGSWAQAIIVGGAGAVTGGVQRVTLASNDPLVAKTPALGTAAMAAAAPFTLATDDTQFGAVGAAKDVAGNVHGQLRYIGETVNTIDGKITACNTGAVVLATGSAAIGKLAANTGIDIGDVDVTSVVPGTAATNLGKAIDSVVGATDTGIALLGKHSGDNVHVTTADGDYEIVGISDFGALNTSPEQHHTFDGMDAVGSWTALNTDTANLATTKKHILGTDALSFDKANTGADSVLAMIQLTVSTVDIGDISPHDIIQTSCYLPSLANVSYVFVRLGTDSTNYNEWRVDAADLTAATFETLALSVGDPSYAGITGNGWNPSAVAYIAVGVAFDVETRTLVGIVFDEVSFHTNQHTSATLNAEVSSSVASANINLHKVSNKVVNVGAGNAGTGTQRVSISTDDVNLAAIKAAVAILGTATYSEATTSGNVVGAVRNDLLAALANTNNEIAPLQVDEQGALFVNQGVARQYSASGVAAGGAPGTDDIIPGSGGKLLRVTALTLTATTTTTNAVFIDNQDNNLWHSAASPLPMSLDADGDTVAGIVIPYNPAGLFTTDAAGEAVTLNSTSAQPIAWSVSWIEVE